ncbi:hypothetical protein BLS_000633, partial [Venturia inaequalis]
LQLSTYTNKTKRKKVSVVPGEIFANIEAIKKAKDEVDAAAAKEATRAKNYTKSHGAKEFEEASKKAAELQQSGMEFKWHL